MDNEFDELLKEWKKHFSKSRQRDYYFNARTNVSVWTYDEVKENVRQELKSKHKDGSQKTSSKPANHLSIRPTTSKAVNQSRYFDFFPVLKPIIILYKLNKMKLLNLFCTMLKLRNLFVILLISKGI